MEKYFQKTGICKVCAVESRITENVLIIRKYSNGLNNEIMFSFFQVLNINEVNSSIFGDH